ncbi:hypothetical protein C5B42_02025 [Candidatus Cerribacteria bacterium 'Amazon FNV 2010 28 9']|uniref:tRNA-dihydrouridine synthase n=1 Tax=Candidatus Cerribacteria bacterium 'Amazon FNV 2010 28 9' TaxID=2081795 RepID=A0A317JQN1_9BACT|nr:MAG: hypothetical protein C5B42_02025 [Candidatus Cerribacteria bacterium 'Amazon FNV 2010 28 9']
MPFSWKSLSKPIVGLSAMDGVTDAAMRSITKKYGNPDFMVTEFTSADGIVRGINKLLRDFYYTQEQRPIIAQIFGANPDSFYECSIICCSLGFDGIDINMGCPADSATHKGGGAALIKTPKLAQKIVRAVQRGVHDFKEGKNVKDLTLPIEFISQIKTQSGFSTQKIDSFRLHEIPVSVKTRVGYEKPVTEEWISTLLETQPALITLHGRTLEQHYSGEASWEEITKAATLAHATSTLLFGNGDLTTPEIIVQRIQQSKVDGVWIGRAAMGNPWIFSHYKEYIEKGEYTNVSAQERCRVALEHCNVFEEINRTVFSRDPLPFLNMRKHLGWYVRGMRDATDIRAQLYQTNNSQEVETVFNAYNLL